MTPENGQQQEPQNPTRGERLEELMDELSRLDYQISYDRHLAGVAERRRDQIKQEIRDTVLEGLDDFIPGE